MSPWLLSCHDVLDECVQSVLRWPFDPVDDQHVDRRARHVELQAELFLQRGHELRPIRIGIRVLRCSELQGERIVPTIRGRAFISAEASLIIEQDDPFAWGIRP